MDTRGHDLAPLGDDLPIIERIVEDRFQASKLEGFPLPIAVAQAIQVIGEALE